MCALCVSERLHSGFHQQFVIKEDGGIEIYVVSLDSSSNPSDEGCLIQINDIQRGDLIELDHLSFEGASIVFSILSGSSECGFAGTPDNQKK